MTVNPGDRRRTFDQPPGNHATWPTEELDFLLRVAVRGVKEALLPDMAQTDLNSHTDYLLFEARMRKLEEQGPQQL